MHPATAPYAHLSAAVCLSCGICADCRGAGIMHGDDWVGRCETCNGLPTSAAKWRNYKKHEAAPEATEGGDVGHHDVQTKDNTR